MYQSCVNVTSIICMESLDVGNSGHVRSRAAPLIYKMYGLSLARMEHFVLWHVHVRIHGGMMLSQGPFLLLPALVSVRCLVCVHDLSKFDTLLHCGLLFLSPLRR